MPRWHPNVSNENHIVPGAPKMCLKAACYHVGNGPKVVARFMTKSLSIKIWRCKRYDVVFTFKCPYQVPPHAMIIRPSSKQDHDLPLRRPP